MAEWLLILYFFAMALVPIVRLRSNYHDRRIFIFIYLTAVSVSALVAPYAFIITLAFMFLPVLIVSMIGDIATGTWFKVLYLFINVLVLGLVTHLKLYATNSTLFIFILLTIFVFLSRDKKHISH